MAKTFNIPAAEQKNSQQIEYFLGVDLSNTTGTVTANRSPNAPNMIRDQVGRVRKRMGYRTMSYTADGGTDVPTRQIFGTHLLRTKEGEEHRLLHAGTRLYEIESCDGENVVVKMERDAMNPIRSVSIQWNDALYIADGRKILRCTYTAGDGFAFSDYRMTEDSLTTRKIPRVMISTTPAGAGTTYEAFNMISPWFEQTFLADGTATDYKLCRGGLAETATVKKLGENGEWSEVTGFTLDKTNGIVHFSEAPEASPVTGMDNISVTVCLRNGEGTEYRETADKICKCTVIGSYGVGGRQDRVFLTGNADYPGYEWYSAFDDPTYFPDTNYNRLTSDGASVVGYAVLNSRLATFLCGSTDGRNCIIRSGELDDTGEALFAVKDSLIGEAPIAAGSFAYLGSEPLFLTERGVYAITPQEITGEKYSQLRSYYINGLLETAPGKTDAVAVTYKDFYVMAVGNNLYLMDGLQKSYERNEPYSSFQYECYYFPNINATALWVDGGRLWFGTADGKIHRFYDDPLDPRSYNDNGEPIDAYWETTDFDGKLFFHSKTYGYVAVRLAAAPLTGCRIDAQRRGLWSEVLNTKEKARYFAWDYIDFEKFVFSADRTPRTVGTKIKVKKVDKIRFRIRNSELNEPLGLYGFGFQWKEPGRNYKR